MNNNLDLKECTFRNDLMQQVLPVSMGECLRLDCQQTKTQNMTNMDTSGDGVYNVAFMTSGGLAPCLSSSIAQLIGYWVAALNDGKIKGVKFFCYLDGYKGVLKGESFVVPEEIYKECDKLNYLGGSPIGNSRVKVRCSFCRLVVHIQSL